MTGSVETHRLPRWAIRNGAPSDKAAILALSERLVEFGPPPWRDPALMMQVDEAKLGAAMDDPEGDQVILVAAQGDTIVGFVHVHASTDSYRPEPIAHVSDLVVSAAFDGQGIGQGLLQAAEAWAGANGYAWISIAVFDTNRRAAAIYEKAGFGRDILRMVKPLS